MSALTIGGLLRIVLLGYGLAQDYWNPVVKYTDVDYSVFMDAAAFLAQGGSPYERATYRYTPLLAYALLPGTDWMASLVGSTLVHSSVFGLWKQVWGKLLFVLCDLAAGWLLDALLAIRGLSASQRWAMTMLWMANPFVAVISTRGNAESILAVLVLATLYALAKNQLVLAAVVFGFSVHFKIYPIIYAVPLWFGIDHFMDLTNASVSKKPRPFSLRLVSRRRVCYGMEFLQETYLYHVTRKDHRHNFSLYFLHMYLTTDTSVLGSVLSFVPQLLLVLVLGIALADDLPLACFLQTFAFVALNKVFC
ncbi:hypothetical protein HDU91_005480 [Kappamyces sp. JEL0680]|nr:hypothetical protein HDU91_005480 [Kappamyces sp. JEL0680]